MSKTSQLLAYLRLFRLPNVFTAIADVTMGFLFVRGTLENWPVLLCLLSGSALLYTSGMVLNDVYDLEQDRRERPDRPLPAGQISAGWATWLGFELLVTGMLLALVAGLLYGEPYIAARWRSGVVAAALALCIVLYDAVLKRTVAGPLVMGACRLLNVLLGMSAAQFATGPAWTLRFDLCELFVAGGIGTYIVGVTWFARSEAIDSRRPNLLLGIAWMLAGFVLLALYPHVGAGDQRMLLKPALLWPMLLLLIGFTVIRRCVIAVSQPVPVRVQSAVKGCILTLIMLDAAVCLAARPTEPYWAIALVSLLAPTLLLGRWIYST